MVIPVGPVSLTLMGLGIEKGKRRAMEGAVGVAMADAILMGALALIATTVGLFNLPFIEPVEIVLGVLLVGLGVRVLTRSESALETVGGIRRVGPTMLAMTLLNPLSLALWLGVVATLPAAVHSSTFSLLQFGLGVTAASLLWHSSVGLGAAWAGPRMSPRVRRYGTAMGGIVMAVIGVMLVV